MPNCNDELNRQLQGLQARITSAENNITATYAGISQLVQSLSADPFTTFAAIPSLSTFNFTDAGYKIMKELLNMLPGYELFQKIQMMDSAALIDTMSGQLQTLAVTIVNAAIDTAQNALQDKLLAEAAYLQGLALGTLSAYDIAQLLNAVGTAQEIYAAATNISNNIGGFITAQADISTCKSTALSINK